MFQGIQLQVSPSLTSSLHFFRPAKQGGRKKRNKNKKKKTTKKTCSNPLWPLCHSTRSKQGDVHLEGGSSSRWSRPLRSPSTPSFLLNADVLLTSAVSSAKMFHFGSKLLLLFLLAFPCGLLSIGKSRSFRRLSLRCRRCTFSFLFFFSCRRFEEVFRRSTY